MSVSSIVGGGTRKKGQRGPRELPVETVLPSTAPGQGVARGEGSVDIVSPLFPR